MNLELEKIKSEIAELRRMVNVARTVRFFRVYYEVELLETIDLVKLLQDMVQSEQGIALGKVYVAFEENHNKLFDNPVLHLAKYSYKITFWVILHKPMAHDVFDVYFYKKLGKACSEPIQRYDMFLELAGLEKSKINRMFLVSLFGFIEEKKVPRTLTI